MSTDETDNNCNSIALADEFAKQIISIAFESVNILHSSISNTKEDYELKLSAATWFRLCSEYTFLQLCYIDRELEAVCTPKQRLDSRNILASRTIEILISRLNSNLPQEMLESIRDECYLNYKNFMDQFSKCRKLWPSEDEIPKSTLLWEFSTHIAAIIEGKAAIDKVTWAFDAACHALRELGTDRFLKSVK